MGFAATDFSCGQDGVNVLMLFFLHFREHSVGCTPVLEGVWPHKRKQPSISSSVLFFIFFHLDTLMVCGLHGDVFHSKATTSLQRRKMLGICCQNRSIS